ncbi:MAG: Eco57I restriction-modification methylase domain-containing protein, partial [Pirellulales bacterium]
MAIALALGAREVQGWSKDEEQLARAVEPADANTANDYRERILAGEDPLGTAFCELRSPVRRREKGATFTPRMIVDAMVDWAVASGTPARVVDPGAGSGRYLLAAGQRLPEAALIGVEIDPIPAILARANLAAAGLAHRARIILADYRDVEFPKIHGPTLFIGNPPYVRHHNIDSEWKRWLVTEADKRKLTVSQLAGLHVHFFLATANHGIPGDYGAFITAAEWLDVNYGKLLRQLFLRDLGGRRIVVIEPAAMPFADAATTAAISYFQIGSVADSIRLKRVEKLERLAEANGNRIVRRERLETERRWSHLTRPARQGPAGYIELGELCRVHRGQVTGANDVWIAGAHSDGLPERVLFPSVTKARELFLAGKVLESAVPLRCVIDLPVDLDVFDSAERKEIDRFLARARKAGADQSYVAVNRKAWWSVGLREPAPILATYMARRPPAFVLNRADARHINIAHGLYPRDRLSDRVMSGLVDYLSTATS